MKKKGWIRIVEAFVAILLIAGGLIIMVDRGYFQSSENSDEIYQKELDFLKRIQVNDSARTLVLNSQLGIESTNDNFPADIKNRIDDELGDYLDCIAKICELDKVCVLSSYPSEEVYSQSRAITVGETFSPRQLKLFCWVK